MKKMRKFMALLIATVMMASNIAPAFATGLSVDTRGDYINSPQPVEPAKPKENETSADLIKNPD